MPLLIFSYFLSFWTEGRSYVEKLIFTAKLTNLFHTVPSWLRDKCWESTPLLKYFIVSVSQ